MKHAKNKGVKIYYKIKKVNDKFIIFLHGFGHNHTVWKDDIKYFTKMGYSSIAVDLRGHGKSDKPEEFREYSFDNFAEDLNAVMKKEKIRKAIIAGHSLGGMIALKYYSMFPRNIFGMVLIDTTFEDPLKGKKLEKKIYNLPITRRILEFVLGNKKVQKQFKEVDFSEIKDASGFIMWLKGAKQIPMKSIYNVYKQMTEFDEKKVLKKIDVPVLIIQGKEDTTTPVWIAKKMHKLIKNSELKIIKGKHNLNISKPKKVDRLILEFIDEIRI